ncbi:hypothetical protein AD45P2_00530 [Alteromonas phage vB_AmaP_AD45-P2]|uniref:Uncharacterized protein n=1 Tax=Pseudorhizobium pelagicum TaxID=1509405 RepID=A0A922NX51_9HYPH|nr:hypothetical protein M610_gp077 [Alteromonas phage vB_AmaP_AD45-P1]AGM47039.1 hypothetical protein AD45P3_00505 [Alteromonas phage vB_AmaP_AD45-P3]AGM47155.1 hypothetical protein AD45P4_00500 [Alteromonas phage vB_AmaP_AD45-P4]AGM47277.1 hypothetical protein AD45P2_00530 [Alteromonas phage vB_AmaP_AD45-P2]KEQ05605.1 hypothetical protein GV68_08735 [Pseudorhizobium pelagicum]AGM46922.1 hypothetical protein AD45P1_00520 [Alteromonas phage vB_AmaP_AD45-P1]
MIGQSAAKHPYGMKVQRLVHCTYTQVSGNGEQSVFAKRGGLWYSVSYKQKEIRYVPLHVPNKKQNK